MLKRFVLIALVVSFSSCSPVTPSPLVDTWFDHEAKLTHCGDTFPASLVVKLRDIPDGNGITGPITVRHADVDGQAYEFEKTFSSHSSSTQLQGIIHSDPRIFLPDPVVASASFYYDGWGLIGELVFPSYDTGFAPCEDGYQQAVIETYLHRSDALLLAGR